MQPQPNPSPQPSHPNIPPSPTPNPSLNPQSEPISASLAQPTESSSAPASTIPPQPNSPESNPSPSVQSEAQSQSQPQTTKPLDSNSAQNPQTIPSKKTSKPKLFAKGSFKTLIKQGSFWLLVATSFFGLMGIIVGAIGISAEVDALNQKADAEKRLTSMRKTLLGYATRLGIKVDEDGQPIEGEVPTGPNIASKNYLYIGEWGLKIYIPNSLKNVSYVFNNTVPKTKEPSDKPNITSVCISAIPQDATYTPEFAQLSANPRGLGCLYRSTTKTPENLPAYQWRLVKWDSRYYYNYSPPQENFSKDEAELAWETAAIESVQNMLTNVEGITEF